MSYKRIKLRSFIVSKTNYRIEDSIISAYLPSSIISIAALRGEAITAHLHIIA